MELKKTKSALEPGWYFMQGDEACAEGVIAAGCRFYAGYPITPASEVMTHNPNSLDTAIKLALHSPPTLPKR